MVIILNTNNWRIFNLFDLFEEIKKGKRLIEEDRIKGQIAYFSASEFDNGLTDFINNPLFIEKDSLIYTTFGDVFYIEGEFTASDEITILKSKRINKYSGLFIATILNCNKYKYAFGRKAFLKRLKYQTLLLPIQTDLEGIPIIDKKNKFHKKGYIPDWEYMETYIKSLPYGDLI
jgi:putative type II site-specific deoxyribonuclease